MKDRTNISLATLEKLSSADGFWVIQPDRAQLGKVYVVDLDSIRHEVFVNKPTGKQFKAEVIDAVQDDGEWHHFPTELLKIEKPEPVTPQAF